MYKDLKPFPLAEFEPGIFRSSADAMTTMPRRQDTMECSFTGTFDKALKFNGLSKT
jgi:hypothetical protein